VRDGDHQAPAAADAWFLAGLVGQDQDCCAGPGLLCRTRAVGQDQGCRAGPGPWPEAAMRGHRAHPSHGRRPSGGLDRLAPTPTAGRGT